MGGKTKWWGLVTKHGRIVVVSPRKELPEQRLDFHRSNPRSGPALKGGRVAEVEVRVKEARR